MSQNYLGNYKLARLSKGITATLLLMVLANVPATAQWQDESKRLCDSLRLSRKAEAQGNWEQAGSQYYSLLNTGFAGVNSTSREFRAALGRRAIACLTIATNKDLANQGLGTDGVGCESLNLLVKAYQTMKELEPNCPTWPFLASAVMCSQGRYADARAELQRSIRTTGGQPAVRDKAQKLLAHINPYANSDQAKMTAEDSIAVKMLLSGQVGRNFGTVAHSNNAPQGESITEQNRRWNENTAKQNAWNAGDTGALNRLNGGAGTDADKSKYGGF
jgi:hypothetical protein